MGIIQNAINQTIGTVGVAARLAPGYEARQAEQGLKNKLKTFEKKAGSELGAEDYLEEKTEMLETIAEIRPTKKNINAALQSGEALGKERANIRRIAEANKKAAAAQEEKRLQAEKSKAFWSVFTEGGLYK